MRVSELEMEKLAQSVTDIATRRSGAEFGSFFQNVADEKSDGYLAAPVVFEQAQWVQNELKRANEDLRRAKIWKPSPTRPATICRSRCETCR